MKKLAIVFAFAVLQICANGQTATPRPRILGIDHVSFYTTAARWREKAIRRRAGPRLSRTGRTRRHLRYLVGKQWVGYSPAPDPKSTDRMDHVALRTDNIVALRKYLIGTGN